MGDRREWPLAADHPDVGRETCPFCENKFAGGDMVTFHALPPTDAENKAKQAAGAAYTTPAVLMHVACANALDAAG